MNYYTRMPVVIPGLADGETRATKSQALVCFITFMPAKLMGSGWNGTYPMVRDHDEAAFGCYRTKQLILGYMSALAAGDTDTVLAL